VKRANPESITTIVSMDSGPAPSGASRNDKGALLPIIGQHLFAGLAEPGAVLLQAGQHDRIAVIHHRTAEARNVARAGIVPLLRRRARGDQDKRNNEKKSEHRIYAHR